MFILVAVLCSITSSFYTAAFLLNFSVQANAIEGNAELCMERNKNVNSDQSLLFPFVFRLYRAGFKFKIKVITEMAKNDPNPNA